MRNLRDPLYGRIPTKPISVESGGTGADNIVDAIVNLGGIPTNKINDPGGPLGLTLTGQIPPEVINYNDINTQTTLKGPESLGFNETVTFKITNYDIAKTYSVAKIGDGAVSIVGDTITYTAPNAKSFAGDGFNIVAQLGGVGVPSRRVELQLDAEQSVNKPTITDPNKNGKTGLSTEYTFASSAFSFTGSNQTHLSSDWELATSPNFGATNVFSATNDTNNLVGWTPSGILYPSTVYYVRVRHKGSASGYSLWSNPIQFTTGIDYPNTLRQQLRHSDPETGDLFGWNVILSGDNTTLVVAAPNKKNASVDMDQFGASEFMESFGTVSTYILDARNWFGAVSMYGYIYACAYGTGADDGAIVAFNESTGTYAGVFGSTNSRTGIATRKDTQGVAVELWECGTGFIGSWHGGMGDFYPHPNIPNHQFRGICVIGDDVYLCAYGGLIYSFNRPDTLSERTLAVFHNEVGPWSGVYDIDGTLYATTYADEDGQFTGNEGLIIKFEGNATGGRTVVNTEKLFWTGLLYHHGILFACTGKTNGKLYYQSKSTGDFVAITAEDGVWNGLFVANDTVCAVRSNGYIYKVPWNTKGVLGGTFAGAAYVFKKVNNTWTQQAKILPDDSLGWDCFGASLSLSHDGNTLLAWSPRRYSFTEANNEWSLEYADQGKAYVFNRSGETWTQTTVIDRPAPKRRVLAKVSSSAFFGSDGALWNCTSINEAGTILAVASSWELVSGDAKVGIRKGYVYIYEKVDSAWSHRDTITIEDQSIAAQSMPNTNLCPVLNAAGTTLYLGVPGFDRTINSQDMQGAGKVDIYTYNGTSWDKSPNPILMVESLVGLYFHAAFGIMVRVNRDETKMFVTNANRQGENLYSVYVFEKNQSNQWVQSKRLGWGTALAHSPKIDIDERGYGVSVGLPFIDLTGEGQAEVYKDRDNDWSNTLYDYYQMNSLQQTIEGDMFGYSTALNASGDTVFIGSPGNNMINPTRNNVGKVYIYSK